MTFVLDASITIAWCFEDEATATTEATLDRVTVDGAVAPGVWSLEVANALLVAERRGRVTESQTTRFLELLRQLPIHIDVTPVDAAAVVAAGRRHGLTAYNSAYVTLAERLGAPLATLDQRVAQAARTAGVSLVAPV